MSSEIFLYIIGSLVTAGMISARMDQVPHQAFSEKVLAYLFIMTIWPIFLGRRIGIAVHAIQETKKLTEYVLKLLKDIDSKLML